MPRKVPAGGLGPLGYIPLFLLYRARRDRLGLGGVEQALKDGLLELLKGLDNGCEKEFM